MHNLGGSHFSIKLFPRIQPNENVKVINHKFYKKQFYALAHEMSIV